MSKHKEAQLAERAPASADTDESIAPRMTRDRWVELWDRWQRVPAYKLDLEPWVTEAGEALLEISRCWDAIDASRAECERLQRENAALCAGKDIAEHAADARLMRSDW